MQDPYTAQLELAGFRFFTNALNGDRVRRRWTKMKNEDNELLVRVSRGTPAGELFRRLTAGATGTAEAVALDRDSLQVRRASAGSGGS